MKKIITSVALGALAMQMTFADQISPSAVVIAEEPVACECSFDGLFLGLGIGGSFLKNKGDTIKKQNIDRFLGSVLVGGGKVFNDTFYVGIDGLFDFQGSKKKDLSDDEGEVLGNTKNGRFLPSLGLRLGIVKCDWNSMLYARVSGSRLKVSFQDTEDAKFMKVSKIVPAFAIGFEKMFSNRVSSRVEVEYLCRAKKAGSIGEGAEAKEINAKVGNGFTIRALVSYNVKM